MPREFPTASAAASRVPLYPSDAHAWDVHNGAAVSPTMHLLPVTKRLEDMVGRLFVDFVKTVDSNYASMLVKAESLRAEFSAEVAAFTSRINERLGSIETVLDGKLSEELDPAFTRWLAGKTFLETENDPVFTAWVTGTSVRLGGGSTATSTTATALGYNAKCSADGSVQLGDGINSTSMSLQFRNANLFVQSSGSVAELGAGFPKASASAYGAVKIGTGLTVSDGVVSSAGQPNVIETVKVNGEALAVTDKSVDIPAPDAYTKEESDARYVPFTVEVLTDQWDVIPPDGHDVSEYKTPIVLWGDVYRTGTESWEYSSGSTTPSTVSYDRDERGPLSVALEKVDSYYPVDGGQIVRRVVKVRMFGTSDGKVVLGDNFPKASNTDFGAVKIGTGLTVSDGVVSSAGQPNVIEAVKVNGESLEIDSSKAVNIDLSRKADEYGEWEFSGADWRSGYTGKISIREDPGDLACSLDVYDGDGEHVMSVSGSVDADDVSKIDFSDPSRFDPTVAVVATRKRVLRTGDADLNVIETIKVNGAPLIVDPSDKSVDVPVPELFDEEPADPEGPWTVDGMEVPFVGPKQWHVSETADHVNIDLGYLSSLGMWQITYPPYGTKRVAGALGDVALDFGFPFGPVTRPSKRVDRYVTAHTKRYAVVRPVASGNTYQLSDYAMNIVDLPSSGEYTFTFPPRTGDRVRDFVLKLNVTADPLPTVMFVKHDTDKDPPRFEGDDGWGELELGVNFFGFTETS